MIVLILAAIVGGLFLLVTWALAQLLIGHLERQGRDGL